MTEIVFLLEEKSAKSMLKKILPRIVQDGEAEPRYITFEGKSDLQRNLNEKLKKYRNPNAVFLVLMDKDSGDCIAKKDELLSRVPENKQERTLIRIACHELESFYLGDLEAVGKGMNVNVDDIINDSMYQTPDNLSNAKQQLTIITNGAYQSVAGSCAIAPHMDVNTDIDRNRNKSHSFKMLIEGIRTLIGRL